MIHLGGRCDTKRGLLADPSGRIFRTGDLDC